MCGVEEHGEPSGHTSWKRLVSGKSERDIGNKRLVVTAAGDIEIWGKICL